MICSVLIYILSFFNSCVCNNIVELEMELARKNSELNNLEQEYRTIYYNIDYNNKLNDSEKTDLNSSANDILGKILETQQEIVKLEREIDNKKKGKKKVPKQY